jgi:hypothetical protein
VFARSWHGICRRLIVMKTAFDRADPSLFSHQSGPGGILVSRQSLHVSVSVSASQMSGLNVQPKQGTPHWRRELVCRHARSGPQSLRLGRGDRPKRAKCRSLRQASYCTSATRCVRPALEHRQWRRYAKYQACRRLGEVLCQ